MNAPRVSVLIPTYNYGRYLPEAIESVLAQDLTDFELLIADDASADDTAARCAPYAAADPRIRFVQHSRNLGMVANWNWCLRESRGRYIKFLLADDRLNGGSALRRMADALDRDAGLALVTCARQLIGENGDPLEVSNPLGPGERRITGTKWIAAHLDREPRALNSIGEPTAVMFRRADAARGFDETYRQLVDLEMWLHLLQKGDLQHLGDPLCCFRKHARQQTEVNRLGHAHPREEIRLIETYGDPARRAFRLYWKMRRLQRYHIPALDALAAEIGARFTRTERIRFALRYRLWRLAENARHSWHKRRR